MRGHAPTEERETKVMKLSHLSGIAAIALAAMTGAASATLFSGSATLGPATGCNGCVVSVFGNDTTLTLPTNIPFGLLDLGTSAGTTNAQLTAANATIPNPGGGINSIVFTDGAATINAAFTSGLYAGNIGSVASSPFGGAQDGTANPSPNKNYLVDQPGGSVTLNYSSAQSTFSLLWGTLDSGTSQNLLGLALGLGTDSITGQDIANVITGLGVSFTDQKLEVGVIISNLGGTFMQVTATNNAKSAFEFVPSPSPLIGHGLLVLLAVGGVLFGSKVLENRNKIRIA
jgi:hypothetical protein